MRVAPDREATPGSVSSAESKHRVGRHWRLWILAIRYARAFIFLINVRTLGLASLACMMVYFCESEVLDLRFRMEFSIISVGTVFPLVFSIQQAFQRREEALRQLSTLKGQLMGLYFSHRDWDVSDGVRVRANLGNDDAPHALRAAELITQLLSALKRWLSGHTAFESEAEWRMLYGTTALRKEITHQLSGDFFRGEEGRQSGSDSDSGGEGGFGEGDCKGAGGGAASGRSDGNTAAEDAAEQDPHWQRYFEMYDVLSLISVHNEDLTPLAGCTKAGEAGMSRLSAYLTKTVEVIERLRSIREYRTPFMLRYVSFVLVLASIFLAAPYFAYMCNDSPRWADDTSGRCPAGYFTAVLYVMVVSTLFHVQVALENPFDGIGMDDVFVNMDREFAVTVRRYQRSWAAAKGLGKLAAAGQGSESRTGSDLKSLSILVDAADGGGQSIGGGGSAGAASAVAAAAFLTHGGGAEDFVCSRHEAALPGSARPGSGSQEQGTGRHGLGSAASSRPGSSPRQPPPSAWGSVKMS